MDLATTTHHDRGGVSMMRRPRFRLTAALVAALQLCTACFTYVPPKGAPTPGAAIALDLTDQGRIAHSKALGPGILRVAGALKGMDGDRYVIDVASVIPIRGQELPVSGVSVTLAPGDVTDVRVRTLSKKRTALVVGGAVAIVATFLITKGFKSGTTPPEGPPGSGGPDQYRGSGGR